MPTTINGTTGITVPSGQLINAGFTSYFESAQQNIGSGFANSITVSHGLGAQPKLMYIGLKCVTTDLGYAVGDEINWPTGSYYAIGGFVTWTSTTQCGFVVNANLQIPNKGTGTFSTITYANWKVIIRAWA